MLQIEDSIDTNVNFCGAKIFQSVLFSCVLRVFSFQAKNKHFIDAEERPMKHETQP
jgi:hypothetical protein